MNLWAPEPEFKPIPVQELFAKISPAGRSPWFISHRYADQAGIEATLKALPPHVEPVIFPPIEVQPDDFVSNHLVDAIKACDGLIYFGDLDSPDWQWVNFERRFALRISKRVARCDPAASAFALDLSKPHNIIVPIWNPNVEADDQAVQRALGWLARERSVYRWTPSTGSVGEAMRRGATPVLFFSNAALETTWPGDPSKLLSEIDADFDRLAARIVQVWLAPPQSQRLERVSTLERSAAVRTPLLRLAFHPREPLLINSGDQFDSRVLDNVLVRIEYRASRQATASPTSPPLTDEERFKAQKDLEKKLGMKPWEGAQLY